MQLEVGGQGRERLQRAREILHAVALVEVLGKGRLRRLPGRRLGIAALNKGPAQHLQAQPGQVVGNVRALAEHRLAQARETAAHVEGRHEPGMRRRDMRPHAALGTHDDGLDIPQRVVEVEGDELDHGGNRSGSREGKAGE